MELKDLVGKHELTGVDMNTKTISAWYGNEIANCINFTLDGKTYSVVEDPSDGYHSSMKEILVMEMPLSNTFAPVKVLASMSEDGDDNILELRDVKNGKVILRVGTDDYDDYYPTFVSDWTPENLSVNEGK